MRLRIIIVSLLVVCCPALLMAPPAAAETLANYIEGEYGFHYAQWPWGPYVGDFHALGPALGDTLDLVPGDEACGGFMTVDLDTFTAYCYGLVANLDLTYDVAGLLVRSATPLTPGSYPVDPVDLMGAFFFFDDIVNFELPASSAPSDLGAWLDTLVCEHKLLSSAGTIVLSAVDHTQLVGTFSGTIIDEADLLICTVTDGVFNMVGGCTEVAGPRIEPITLDACPNPFNPLVTLRYAIPRDGNVCLRVMDVRGRTVRQLENRYLTAGRYETMWDGRNTAGRSVASGVYFSVLDLAGKRQTAKLVLAR